MNRTEHLLVCLGEEASEVIKDADKALRFGPSEIWPELGITNAERVMREYYDLKAVLKMLQAEGVLPVIEKTQSEEWMRSKTAKVEKHLLYSRECGTLQSGGVRDENA